METEKLIETVGRAKLGDRNAIQNLYLDAHRSVYYLALRMVKNPEDAEYITQEIFITVHEKISELREPAAFYKWLNQITANRCNGFLRKFKGIAKLDDEEEILGLVEYNPLNFPDKAIDDEATRKIILDVIDALPDGQRAYVLYYYYQQYAIVQIAERAAYHWPVQRYGRHNTSFSCSCASRRNDIGNKNLNRCYYCSRDNFRSNRSILSIWRNKRCGTYIYFVV